MGARVSDNQVVYVDGDVPQLPLQLGQLLVDSSLVAPGATNLQQCTSQNPLVYEPLQGGYPRTAAELAAGVTIANERMPPYWVPRYGANTVPTSTDCTAAIQAAVTAGTLAKVPAYLPGWYGEARITSNITVSGSRAGLVGDGMGSSRVFCDNCSGFSVAAGCSFITFEGFSIAQAARYTVPTPNAFFGIAFSGTAASPNNWCDLEDLFIDGFGTAIQANGVRSSSLINVVTAFGKNGIIAGDLTASNVITNCNITGGGVAAASAYPGSIGLQIGDGSAAAEGWEISNSNFYGFAVGIDGFASANCYVSNVIVDQATQFGVLLRSSTGACTGWSIDNVFCFMIGAAADSGFYLTNSVAPSAGSDHGHLINGCRALKYQGSALTNGLLCDGTQESNHRICNNAFKGDAFDLRFTTGSGLVVTGNRLLNAGAAFAAGVNPLYGNNIGTVSGIIPTVASAAAVTLPTGPKVFTISGTTNITSVSALGHTGDTLTLIFSGALTFTDGSNLKLNGNFVTTADDTITLVCDGTNYYEMSRSAN